MSCGHCAARVEKSLNKINGIEAKVDLDSRTAKLNLTEPVTNQQIIDAVDAAVHKGHELALWHGIAGVATKRAARYQPRCGTDSLSLDGLCAVSRGYGHGWGAVG